MATRQKNTGTDAATDETVSAAEAEAVKTDAPSTGTDTDAADTRTDAVPARSTLVEPAAEGLMSEADAPAATADDTTVAEENHAGRVPIKLANPIEHEEHQRRLRLPVKEGGYQVHDVVWVTPDDAAAIINAGLAQVDPEDQRAVLAAVRGKHDGMRA